jgi:hypothetical protein
MVQFLPSLIFGLTTEGHHFKAFKAIQERVPDLPFLHLTSWHFWLLGSQFIGFPNLSISRNVFNGVLLKRATKNDEGNRG